MQLHYLLAIAATCCVAQLVPTAESQLFGSALLGGLGERQDVRESIVGGISGDDKPQDGPNYDYILLRLQTRGGLCFNGTYNCTKLSKNDPPPLQWTIQGFWAMNFSSSEPAVRCDNDPYNATLVDLLREMVLNETRLDVYTLWPGYLGVDGHALWKHEWETYGSCASPRPKPPIVPLFPPEFAYFLFSFGAYGDNNITQILEKGGIMPDDNKALQLSNFMGTIEKGVNSTKINVVCQTDAKTKKTVLQEVHLCLGLEGSPLPLVPCPKIPNTCPESVYYMTIDGSSGAALLPNFVLAMLAAFVARFMTN